MTTITTNSPDAKRLITPSMLILWLVLATVPLWISRVGLYPYLGIEILIWSTYRFYAAGIAVAIIALVWVIIEKTPFGATVKAGAHDSEIVRALGINLTRLRLLVFVFGTMLAAIAGIIVAPIWGIRPHMGVDAVIPAFLVIVLGGVGSFWGAVVAGLLVGLCVGLAGAYASEWSLLSMYILLVAVVTFRARGLWGKKSVLEA